MDYDHEDIDYGDEDDDNIESERIVNFDESAN
jgi:hypothetical protein